MRHTILATAFSFLLVGLALIVPDISYAQSGLVPCGSPGQPECNVCHLTQLAQNFVEFFVRITFIAAALLFAYAGFLFFTGGASPDRITNARKIFTNTFVGIIIVLTSWFVVDVILKTLVGQGVNPFTSIFCDARTQSTTASVQPSDTSNLKASGSNDEKSPVFTFSSDPIPNPTLSNESMISRIEGVEPFKDTSCLYAAQAGISNQCNRIQALMAVESAGDTEAGNGSSFGLMQLTVGTAKELDPFLNKLEDTEVEKILLIDPDKNIELGSMYYAKLLERYKDSDLATAAYNGGPGANEPSKDCPGLRRWQCEWDNPEHTIPNTGYKETRDYVENVKAIEQLLELL